VVEAELLLHVVDVSHPKADEQIVAVNEVLQELHAQDKPTLMVFNKTDSLGVDVSVGRFRELYPGAVFVSAKTGLGMPDLLEELGTQLRPVREVVELDIPHAQAAVLARLHAVGQVVESDYDRPRAARVKALLPPHFRHEFAKYERPADRVAKR
jgi:GTP-binding protein HflX